MGDVEDMIGTLEGEDDEEEATEEEASEPEEEREETFGLDLDAAWRSPERDDDE